MKKLTAIFLCFAMALSLAACGNTTSSTNESSTPESSVPPASSEASDTSSTAASQEPASQEETEVEAGNTLVVYFSATFVEANDFTGKTVIPFATSASSGLGESGQLLAELAGTGDWQEGMRFRSSVSEGDMQEWLDSLSLS